MGTSFGALIGYLQELFAAVLGLSPEEMPDPDQPLAGLGLDSLMVVEVKNQIQSTLQIALPVSRLFNAASVSELASTLFGSPGADSESEASALTGPEVETRVQEKTILKELEAMDHLSDKDVDEALRRMLEEVVPDDEKRSPQ
jgi:acyl carrier protein